MRMIRILEASTKDGLLHLQPPTIDSKLHAMIDAVYIWALLLTLTQTQPLLLTMSVWLGMVEDITKG
jgi:hypothetical protein